MPASLKAVKVSDRVHWVGAIDWDIVDFHGYTTRRGSTYNAYLISAEKLTLVDSVKAPFKDELLTRIASVVTPSDIKIVISNHAEMDHSGCLAEVIEAVKPEQVFASHLGAKALHEHYHGRFEAKEVEDGGTLDLGDATLRFFETRMLHWPDSMFTYLPNDKLLFSQDAFGMHLAADERFDDEVDDCVLHEEAATYYANILMPFSPIVAKQLGRMKELGLALDLVAPDHGPIWRRKFGWIVDAYGRWAAQKPTLKAVVAYDTMWGSTVKMARAIADGLAEGGAIPRMVNMRSRNRTVLATELLEAGAFLVGTPTINNNMFPTLADGLTYVRGLRPQNLIGATFGSYGWSGEGPKQCADILTDMKIDLVSEPLTVRFVPDDDALTKCRELGLKVAGRLREIVEAG
jgi:flavorubredoxin